MALLIRILILVLAVGAVYWVLRRFFPAEKRLKCETWRHCRKLFHDGSRCGFGAKETFKTIVYLENCVDYESR